MRITPFWPWLHNLCIYFIIVIYVRQFYSWKYRVVSTRLKRSDLVPRNLSQVVYYAKWKYPLFVELRYVLPFTKYSRTLHLITYITYSITIFYILVPVSKSSNDQVQLEINTLDHETCMHAFIKWVTLRKKWIYLVANSWINDHIIFNEYLHIKQTRMGGSRQHLGLKAWVQFWCICSMFTPS